MPREASGDAADTHFEVLTTAAEAWPAFERAVLSARREILAGFRIFDMATRLRSPEALAIGRDWFDLLAHVVNRGVTLRIVVSDFDPVMATPLHEIAWRTVRQGAALAEITGARPPDLDVHAALHPARAGAVPRMAFMPMVLERLRSRLRNIRGVRRARQAVGLTETTLPELHTVSHHQKLAVIDGETLYLGGLDLNERRFDTLDHDRDPAQTWSDVQLLLRGPEAAEARQHLLDFEAVCAGSKGPAKARHLARTLSAPRRMQFPFLSPRTILREVETAHVEAIAAARRIVYIETQFLRSSVIARALARAARANPDLSLILILPALPDDVAFEGADGLDARYGLALQRDALETVGAAFGGRATFATPVQKRLATREGPDVLAGSPVIHVHNKVLITDDDYALVGSANLNGRSMRWDTEAALHLRTHERVAALRAACCRHWWAEDLPTEAKDPARMQAWWDREIAKNAVKLPENRRGFLVPHDPDKKADLAQPLPGVTEDIV